METTTETATAIQVGDWVVCHNHEGIPFRGFHVLNVFTWHSADLTCGADLALACWEERDAFEPYSGRRYGDGERSVVRLEGIREVWRKTLIIENKPTYAHLWDKSTIYLGRFPEERWEWVKLKLP